MAVNHAKQHDTVKYTNAQFLWGTKDGSEIVEWCPALKQTGLINFTGEMKKHLPFLLKLALPILRKANNRLGIYTYKR